MAYRTCPDCGERVYNLGCVNCNEEAYIAEQDRLTDLIESPAAGRGNASESQPVVPRAGEQKGEQR